MRHLNFISKGLPQNEVGVLESTEKLFIKVEIMSRTLKQEIITRLNSLCSVSEENVYVVTYNGKRLTMTSGKGSWKTISAAKNALRNEIADGHYKERLAIFKELEDEGIIKYEKL